MWGATLETSVKDSRDGQLAALIEAALAGSAAALGQLLDCYRLYLIQVAAKELSGGVRSKVSDSDIVQESCLDAIRSFPQFHGRSVPEFHRWLLTLFRNNLADAERAFQRTQKRDLRLEHSAHRFGETSLGEVISPSSVVARNERLDQLRIALRRLPESYQQIIQLRSYDRKPFEEIARLTGRTSAAARKLWTRAIAALKYEMETLHESART